MNPTSPAPEGAAPAPAAGKSPQAPDIEHRLSLRTEEVQLLVDVLVEKAEKDRRFGVLDRLTLRVLAKAARSRDRISKTETGVKTWPDIPDGEGVIDAGSSPGEGVTK